MINTTAYLANTEARVIHKNPANEACNLDQIRHRMKLTTTEMHMTIRNNGGWKLCERCFPEQEARLIREHFGAPD